MSHVLVATVGASPQVVTETLYAIHKEGWTWPDRIVLFTTSLGAEKARAGLIDEGHLARLCKELEVPQPTLDDADFCVVPDADGQPVNDARSLADHEALGDFIMTGIRDLTAPESDGGSATLHASLAGGRKTMTFYLGYAMSLFGRRDDVLSHVLISEGYEGYASFWYPSVDQAPFEGRNGQRLLPADAEVTLAPIPFIRHRAELPSSLPIQRAGVHFRELVALINLGERVEDLHVRVDLPAGEIVVSSRQGTTVPVKASLGPMSLAFYTVMVRATIEGNRGVLPPRPRKPKTNLRAAVIHELMYIFGLSSSNDPEENYERLFDENERIGRIRENSMEQLSNEVNMTWFHNRLHDVKQALTKELPAGVVGQIVPDLIFTAKGDRVKVDKRVKEGRYGIPLDPGQLEITDRS